MTDESPDVVLGVIDRIHAWRTARPGLTILGSHLGRLVLTSRRLWFLSSGFNGVFNAFDFHPLGRRPAGLRLGATPAEEVDTRALVNPGSLNLSLRQIAGSEVRRRYDLSSYLRIEVSGSDGATRPISFMWKRAFRRQALLDFRESLDLARAAIEELPPVDAEPEDSV